ncbi:MAG: BatD family protein, partial [Planctomycetaceae bacterium]|nr:BatD family protein [Planctomycetaceae bacterium]
MRTKRVAVLFRPMLIRNVFTLPFVCFFAVSAWAEPQLTVRLERSAIYEGESFVYQLVVSDTSPVDAGVMPDTSAWKDFDVRLLATHSGQQGGSSMSMTIINGKVVKDNRLSMTYTTYFRYALTPRRTGLLTIPLPQVSVGGKTLIPQSFFVEEGDHQILADHSITVLVSAPEDQDIVFLTIETNRQRLYPMQPLEITAVMRIKGFAGRLSATDPLSVIRQLPQLYIPWSVETPKGFQSNQKAEQQNTTQIKRSDA